MRNHLLTVAILILFSLNIYGQTDLSKIIDSLKVQIIGKELPNIVFTDSLGNKFDLQSLQGSMVAINIWAFGCKPCIEEIPQLNKFVEKYKDSVKFISILADGQIQFNKEFNSKLNEFNFKYATLSTNKNIMDTWGLLMIFPTHIILDKNGIVLDLIFGSHVEKIETILKNNS